MKISDVAQWHRDCTNFGNNPRITQKHLEMAEAIEQHHKDLMGLVERWRGQARTQRHPLDQTGPNGAIGSCADQLESLINPKD